MPDALSATDANRRPVIWTVSVTRLARLFREVSPEFDERAQTEAINLGFEDALEEIRRRLRTRSRFVVRAAVVPNQFAVDGPWTVLDSPWTVH